MNYAGDDEAAQYFAIARDEAREAIAQLEAGRNVTSIGVNGVAPAVADGGAGDSTGVWVSSVESGSPADKAGVEAGDIITKLEGVELATEDSDGPMADYCDILRTNDADDALGIEVVHFDTQEVLEGQLNGRELKQTFSFAEEASEELESETTGGSGDGYSYAPITDDTEALEVNVPEEWPDTNGGAWEFEGEEVGVSASTDLAAYADNWDVPGMFFGASSSLTSQYDADGLLDYFDYSETCGYDARYDYEDAAYTGKYDLWTDCDGTGSQFLVLAAAPEDGSYLTVVQIQAVNEADIEAAEEILGSFVVVGEV